MNKYTFLASSTVALAVVALAITQHRAPVVHAAPPLVHSSDGNHAIRAGARDAVSSADHAPSSPSPTSSPTTSPTPPSSPSPHSSAPSPDPLRNMSASPTCRCVSARPNRTTPTATTATARSPLSAFRSPTIATPSPVSSGIATNRGYGKALDSLLRVKTEQHGAEPRKRRYLQRLQQGVRQDRCHGRRAGRSRSTALPGRRACAISPPSSSNIPASSTTPLPWTSPTRPIISSTAKARALRRRM